MPFTDKHICYINPINIRAPAKDACLYSSPASVPSEDFVAAINHPRHHVDLSINVLNILDTPPPLSSSDQIQSDLRGRSCLTSAASSCSVLTTSHCDMPSTCDQ
ncbi:hypothetical protein EAF00_002328 [Botryotinia globosa]|nr:hypothetical protein EAF00_002328 [Botryotinia globosa]